MDTKQIHILVVDDDVDMADSTAAVLALWGYDATACESGAMALACARFRRPAAVLLDIAMPGMNGFQFARAFHDLPGCEAVPLVAISEYSPQAYSIRAWEAGISHCLLKAADLNQLKTLLALLTRPKAAPSGLRAGMRLALRELRSRRAALVGARGGVSRGTRWAN